MISVTLYSDPACPWACSERPALRVLDWRYGGQLDWRLVLIGLTEEASQYEARGYTPLRGALKSGLTTQEVAALMCEGNDVPDREGAEQALLALVDCGEAERLPLGDDALWVAPAVVSQLRRAA